MPENLEVYIFGILDFAGNAEFKAVRGNMAFFAKFRRKLRRLEKCSNVKKLRKTEPHPIFTGSYKKKQSVVWGV